MPDILKSAQGPKLLPPSQTADPVVEDLPLPYSARGGELPKEPEPIPAVPPPVPKKSGKSLMLAVLLFLVATLPLAVYFTSQQRQLADLRGRAQEGVYPNTGVHASIGTDCDDFGTGTQCHGNVTIHVCPDGPSGHGPGPICNNPTGTAQGDVDCVAIANANCAFVQLDTPNGSGMTCYPTNCQQTTPAPTQPPQGTPNPTSPPSGQTPPPPGETPPPGSTPTPTSLPPTATPTPTPPPGGTCELIKLYDAAGTDITQSLRDGTKKLAIGEEVTIATSKGNATKTRFRIQGIADWAENDPSKTTATEYRLSITIPSTLTQAQGTFEVEVLINGQWK